MTIKSVSHTANEDQATATLNVQVNSTYIDNSNTVSVNTNSGIEDQVDNDYAGYPETLTDARDQISLVEGWNLVSTPHLQADDTEELLSGVSYSSVYAYNDGDGQWVTDTADMELDSMDAVYIDSDKPQEISLSRDSGAQAPPSTAVEEGWNLIGTSTNVQNGNLSLAGDVALSSVIDSNNDNKGLDRIYSPSFNPSGEWIKTDAGDFSNENLEAFQGYWVFMDSSDGLAGQTT